MHVTCHIPRKTLAIYINGVRVQHVGLRKGAQPSKKQASIDMVTLPIPAPTAAETEE